MKPIAKNQFVRQFSELELKEHRAALSDMSRAQGPPGTPIIHIIHSHEELEPMTQPREGPRYEE